MASVRLNNVRKVYRRDTQEVPVLDGVTLEIASGDYVALMGPSGSGKTTLLNLIGGVERIFAARTGSHCRSGRGW